MNRLTHALNPARRDLLAMFALDVEMTRGSGFSLFDANGRKYLDFLSQYGALPFGHNPPAIWSAIQAAARDQVPLMVQPLRCPDAEHLAVRLAEITPGDLSTTTLTNSGAETVEAAIKLARMRTGRHEILSTDNGFHGKTLGALSATGKSTYQDGFGAPVAGFGYVPFGDIEALRSAFDVGGGRIAAFIVEPIQGEGGVVCPPDGYIDSVIVLCREYGILSILDEIQTGLGRTGALFACSGGAEVPDMLLLAKALGGGMMPIGACVVRPSAWDDRFGRLHSSTFAGNALACRVGLAAIDLLLDDEQALIRNVAETGAYLRGRLETLQTAYPSIIREVRGRGFMLGLEFHRFDQRPNSALMAFASINGAVTPLISSYLLNRHGLLTAPLFNDTHVIRLQPPLIIGRPEVDRAIAALQDLCNVLASENYSQLVRHLVAGTRAPEGAVARPMAAQPVAARSAAARPGEFAFLIHYTEKEDIFRSDPSFRQFDEAELANWCAWVKKFGAGNAQRIPVVTSKIGATAAGWIISVPMLPKDMRGEGRKVAEDMIRSAVDLAGSDGATRVGLGAFTSIVTRGGAMVTGRGVPITSGNTLTTISAVKGIEHLAERSGIELGDAHVVVVGASGAIGRLASLMLARLAGQLTLVGNAANPFSPRLLSRVADEVCEMITSQTDGALCSGKLGQNVLAAARGLNLTDDRGKALSERIRSVCLGQSESFPLNWNVPLDDALQTADIVLVATSSELTLIDPDRLRPGTLVCDVARPQNVAQGTSRSGDVLVFDGGLIQPPSDIDLGPFQTLPVNLCWGCLGETLLLSLAGEHQDYSIGSRLALKDADHLAKLAELHGFEPSPPQWYGQVLGDAEISSFAARVTDRRGRLEKGRPWKVM